MSSQLSDDLVCPICRAQLEPAPDGTRLVCSECGSRWPISNGVPRLVRRDLSEQQQKTSAAFGWQWRHFAEAHEEFEVQFLDWIHPIGPDFFVGKRVLDAGCGTGRHAYFAAKYGAKEVVALDLSDAVETARATLAGFHNVQVIQGDLLRPPLRTAVDGGGFDFVYSIGVLHHLPDPEAGLRSLVRLVRPGGTIAIWVYGYEGNTLVRNVVEPLRRLTIRIPFPVLRIFAWPLAVGFHGLARAVYGPLSATRLGRALPLSDYMASVANFSFRQNYGIIFDQLAAPSTAYIRGSELEDWFTRLNLREVRITRRHGNSWRAQAQVGSRPARRVDDGPSGPAPVSG